MEYVVEQQKWIKENNVRPGTIVKVMHSCASHTLGWNNSWCIKMDDCLGGNYQVVEASSSSGIQLKTKTDINCPHNYQFPFFVLKVIDYVPLFKTGCPVLVRNNKSDKWTYALFSHYEEDRKFRFIAGINAWQFCIPYERHEALVGTTKEVSYDKGC